jgi:hypothetical protein
LEKATKGTVQYNDDCGASKCDFYSFKSKWFGLNASVRFLADRVKSDHPNYKGKFNFSHRDTQKWCYGLYDANFAAKNPKAPYDVKLMRIIIRYDLEQRFYGK